MQLQNLHMICSYKFWTPPETPNFRPSLLYTTVFTLLTEKCVTSSFDCIIVFATSCQPATWISFSEGRKDQTKPSKCQQRPRASVAKVPSAIGPKTAERLAKRLRELDLLDAVGGEHHGHVLGQRLLASTVSWPWPWLLREGWWKKSEAGPPGDLSVEALKASVKHHDRPQRVGDGCRSRYHMEAIVEADGGNAKWGCCGHLAANSVQKSFENGSNWKRTCIGFLIMRNIILSFPHIIDIETTMCSDNKHCLHQCKTT